jgi:hypothetical protein
MIQPTAPSCGVSDVWFVTEVYYRPVNLGGPSIPIILALDTPEHDGRPHPPNAPMLAAAVSPRSAQITNLCPSVLLNTIE